MTHELKSSVHLSEKKLVSRRKMLQHLHFIFLCVLAAAVPGHAQNQTGFISIDCGLPANGSYTDSKTGLDYISDETFIDSGIRASIGPDFNVNGTDTQLLYLRSFPQGSRNCYNISVTRGTKYLIRARFLYGNYDNLNKLPIFDLHIGPNKLVNIQILNASDPVNSEVIYNPSSNYMFICLVNVGSGIPFISALEFRPLNNTAYPIQSGQHVYVLFLRKDVGSRTNKQFRFPDDVYDRIWDPYHLMQSTDLSTNKTVEPDPQDIEYQLPSNVMRTAGSPTNTSAPVNFSINVGASGYNFYVCMHFAEIVKLGANQSRQFDINIQYQMDQLNTNWNTRNWIPSLVPHYLSTTTICNPSTGTLITFLIDKTETSTLPPLLNALEIYYIVEFTLEPTNPSDVVAISEIKSMYKVMKNWQGDPCAPQAYVWDGLNCSYNNAQPTITSLSLSFSALTGEIAPEIASLKSLESLDLSNNNLNGSIPDFLSQLSSLKVLKLAGNNLTGAVPVALIQRSQQGSLLLSVDANLCKSISCNNKNNNKVNVVAPVVASAAAFFVIVSLATIFWSRKRRQQAKKTEAESSKTNDRLELNRRQFSYSEILIITNNFENVLGKGGFGTVYHGFLDDTQVAVKVLSPSSRQGYKQFEAEVKLLLRVHHRNLTTLVGYSYEDTNMALIYEFMANGNLEDHLSDNNKETLSWELRLQIALDAAQGLEYLHNGCKPPIVHRDVKTTNILLDDKLRAKISDFGLSRSFLVEDDSHVSTTVAGTPGYLDPEIHGTNWFTEKTDVYSFGVVLLKIITNLPVIAKASENIHITQCVTPLITNGDIETIVDHRLSGAYSVNSVWKFMELAMDCVYSNAMGRPNMSQVVIELAECLAMERYRIMEGQSFQTENPSEVFSMNLLHTGESPLAR